MINQKTDFIHNLIFVLRYLIFVIKERYKYTSGGQIMKKKLFIVIIMSFDFSPVFFTDAKTSTTAVYDSENNDFVDDDSEDDPINAGEFTKYDFKISPWKKIIKIGKSFIINIVPETGAGWDDLSNKEWKEICEENIDLITFRSTNNKVAAVNRKTEKITGRKKGVALIKTFVALANG